MTAEDKAALRALAEAATPGSWRIAVTDGTRIVAARKVVADCGGYPSSDNDEANAAYIAAAHPQAVLSLLDEVERLRAALVEVRRAITNENNINGAAIMDTIWVSPIETAADCIDAALDPRA